MDIEASYNFRRITERLTTSGIVHPDGLKALRGQGYEVVVNLLPDTSEYAIPYERDTVESQGIEYIYIPVDFKRPTSSNFLQFSEALDRVHEKKVHVHCAANYRVSAFCSLYLVSRDRWGAEQAMEFIRSIWQPTEHPGWSEFPPVSG
ncbi:protein tyrosine phosphatase family protein [Acidithiobacillus sp. HP-6]|uniref:protein tyrosine phosphatase family protein n=1 Tax=unclassified Acidithiobacillus TaxID=2614800 RepID=UPI00187A7007|nr:MULTISPECIES: protein tyrosine phosphatase family protein [unclassified Acidithiobacillus]MBE7564258.1 protein tyrosine phosphatase family protein [Acidithiobacillus sp. HP-6]MBE7570172.1 protein tyrosine phosphatase family protein [Acidithiobacillus sp. HP-2]